MKPDAALREAIDWERSVLVVLRLHGAKRAICGRLTFMLGYTPSRTHGATIGVVVSYGRTIFSGVGLLGFGWCWGGVEGYFGVGEVEEGAVGGFCGVVRDYEK